MAKNTFSLFHPPAKQKSGDRSQWGNLHGSALACAVTYAALENAHCSMLVAPNMSTADRLRQEVLQFLPENSELEVVIFPDWETLPYDTFSPHQDITSDRMHCLYQLAKGKKTLVIASAPTLAQRLPPKSYVLGKSLVVKVGETLDVSQLRNELAAAGYNSVDTVYQHGEFAQRGALLDVFPMGSRHAYRIELFDDEIESLRTFDPETQRTIEKVEHIDILPGRECPLDGEGIANFRTRWHERFDVNHKACPVYQDVSAGLNAGGIEYFLPLFFEHTATLFDYLGEESQLFVMDNLEAAYEHFFKEVHHRYENRRGDLERPILPPHEIFLPVNEMFGHMKKFARVNVSHISVEEKPGSINFPLSPPPNLLVDSRAKNPLYKVENFLLETNKRVLFCAESNGRREVLKEQLKKIGVKPAELSDIPAFIHSKETIALTIAPIEEGFNCRDPDVLLIAESQLFGNQVMQARRRGQSKTTNEDRENVIKNLTELNIGAPVVHIEHGVGRYQGLQTIEHDGQADEFLVLVYANDAKLYVPVANLHLISRYSGTEESHAPLHRLGSDQWEKAKRKAAEKIRDVAAELLDIYARRKAREGFVYNNPEEDYQKFAANFPFEETPDQEAAIIAVKNDMISSQPMDRLVCGDVGFGKTEVAMRAAFIAVQNGKQVAVLVPTTLLAQQHYENFRDRFADWPVNIEVMSRFKSQKETTEITKRLADGKVDIIVGTHKLIQGNMKYPDLGLLIIDEEHRFGVRQKEALKSLRSEVDILTMTATPIPRTLNMSMSGIRDLSIIATPPAKRLSVKTFVRETDKAIVKEAIQREIMRGGQVYYLHNEVKTIEKTAQDLQALIPDGRIRVGHGQMRERELENVMADFYHKRFNILVCTTIIETGIDVPSANTIIIDRADMFGLAQLHQLRGRVGRSHHQAYAYLLTPNKKAMTVDAHKRLDAIAEAQDLGAGFTLASHDMEIRGAGELLGDEQSGQMQSIGFSLYMDLLDRAVEAIRQGKTFDIDNQNDGAVDINLRIPALIPEDYLPDVNMRLMLYKRIASCKTDGALEQLQVEMIDRFGLLPEQVKNLFRQSHLRLVAERLGIKQIDAGKTHGRVEFSADTKVEPLKIVTLVQQQPQHFRMEGANHLKFQFPMETPDERLKAVHKVFDALAR